MDSNTERHPVFLIFPPEVTVPKFQSMDYGATTYESSIPFPKFLATNVKIFGTIQILFGLMNFSFGVIFLFTFENPYPRYPFIFVTGYPFWSSILFINSGAFLVALERKTTETLVKMSRSMNLFSALAAMAGIILLAFGFIVDQNYLCGFSGEVSECKAITALFIGILTVLTAFSVIELLISMSFAILTRPFDCCDCEQWC
ncbi:PREDICTED: membrane-spanning 4-domains subfamily A member 5-like isoform X2 [Hipposideros armiger]|uniref:Membrane-spanning 4-domains subfamily A member 5-like isoform X2 n=1 Tax=Hipposideros armiger TaxID=186990 RepID=A0A8B7SE26_HIPAR|nr:PREDICTED: membrane-spanning 4-domains subfamily A member 5-like isoform X2 [Hipposideros armiger]